MTSELIIPGAVEAANLELDMRLTADDVVAIGTSGVESQLADRLKELTKQREVIDAANTEAAEELNKLGIKYAEQRHKLAAEDLIAAGATFGLVWTARYGCQINDVTGTVVLNVHVSGETSAISHNSASIGLREAKIQQPAEYAAVRAAIEKRQAEHALLTSQMVEIKRLLSDPTSIGRAVRAQLATYKLKKSDTGQDILQALKGEISPNITRLLGNT